MRATCEKYHVGLADLPLIDLCCSAEVVPGQVVNVGDNGATGRLAECLHVALLGAPDRKQTRLRHVVLCKVVDSLLADDDICTGGLQLVNQSLEVILLLFEELCEHGGVGDLNLCVDFSLLDLDCAID